MTSDVTPSDPDEQLFKLLDDYVCSLRGTKGEVPDPPDELLQAFPDLAGMLDCLDSLEDLVPPSLSLDDSGDRRIYEEETFVPGITPGLSGGLTASGSDSVHWPCDFGRYELIREVGRGGMGIVYLARQKQLNAMVALKLVGRSQFASAEEVRRFYSEARAAAGLRHPNIVSVHDVGDCHGQHYLTMDFVGGGNLADRLQHGPLDPREAAELLLTVARAVEYLHRHKIVHRDLKPSNIMLDEESIPYVTD
ncbi:MAG: serine/threonine-protein kinase, partial [Planctomycetaceae bacterium]